MGYPGYVPIIVEEPVDIKEMVQQLVNNRRIPAYIKIGIGTNILPIPSDEIASMDAQIYLAELNARQAIADEMVLFRAYEILQTMSGKTEPFLIEPI